MPIQQYPVSTAAAPRTTVVYATAGTYTFTPPAGTSASNPLIADIVVVGGGGGGGGATSSLTGASGSAAQVVSQTSVPITSDVTITVGAGGTGGASNGGTGGNGGTSTFGSYFTALGGNGAAGNTPGSAVSLMPSTTAGTSGVTFFSNALIYASSNTSYLYSSSTATSVSTTSALPYSLSSNGMVFGNSLLVACSSTFASYSSNQGASWTSVPKTGGDYNLRYLNGTFFHMSSGSTYSTSPDGMTWTTRTAPEGWFMDIAWSGSAYAVATNGGNIYSSTDGINWTSRATPGFNFLGIGWAGGSINKFYAVGNNASTTQTYYTASSTGTSWSSATFGFTAAWMQTFYDVNTGRFYVMCGDQGAVGTSIYTTNGTSFTSESYSGESGMAVKFTTAHNNGWSLGGYNGSNQSRVFTHDTSGTRTKIDTQATISAIQGGAYVPSVASVGGRVPGVANALTGFVPGAGASGSVSGGSGGLYNSTLLPVAAQTGTTAAGSGRVPGAGGGGGGTAAQTGGAGGVGAVYITY